MHIFISYAKKDTRDLTQELAERLAELPDVTVWWDDSIQPGGSWAAEIEDEIKRCDLFIVLLSSDVNRPRTGRHKGSFVRKEIGYALRHGKEILPLVTEEIDDVPVQIVDLQHIDLTQNRNKGIAQIITFVRQFTSISEEYAEPIAPESPRSKWRIMAAISALLLVGLIIGVIALLSGDGTSSNQNTPRPTAAVVQNSPTDTPELIATMTVAEIATTLPAATPLPTLNMTEIEGADQANWTNTPTPTDTSTLAGYPGGVDIMTNDEWTPVTREFEFDDYTVTMVLVPKGCFNMGNDELAYYYDDSWIQGVPDGGTICFDEPFWIDQYEVSNGQFNALGGEAGRNSNWTDVEVPRERITWNEALAFCTEKREARLPTEAEWEYSARGPDNLIYPWGNEFDGTRLNCYSVDCPDDGYANTSPIGSYESGKSWITAYDLSGNVWEWTNTIYQDYPYDANGGREVMEDNNNLRVLRGGSWNYNTFDVRAALRFRFDPDGGSHNFGFRCARSY